jgi:hypothetical protein
MITTHKDSLVGFEVRENPPSNCQFGGIDGRLCRATFEQGLAPRQPFRRTATILRLNKDHSALLSRVFEAMHFLKHPFYVRSTLILNQHIHENLMSVA